MLRDMNVYLRKLRRSRSVLHRCICVTFDVSHCSQRSPAARTHLSSFRIRLPSAQRYPNPSRRRNPHPLRLRRSCWPNSSWPTGLGPAERAAWCARLLPVARERIARPGDQLAPAGDCSLSVTPAREEVSGTRVLFDLAFFFEHPYAAASFDRDTRTLYLPLAALTEPWMQNTATRHEWRHARIHQQALAGDKLALALQSIVTGPEYRPDPLYVDEIPVNLCDLVDARDRGAQPEPWRTEMATNYATMLTTELGKLAPVAMQIPDTRFGIAGMRIQSFLPTSFWVGGQDAASSIGILRSVQRDASEALTLLRETTYARAQVHALPLIAATCTP
jgi:hypothetical protein